MVGPGLVAPPRLRLSEFAPTSVAAKVDKIVPT